MARGPKRHLKRLAAPKHWMLDKLTGRYAPRPSTGPHKLRECLPLIIFLRNRLKYALTYHEVKMIMKERQVQVDGKVRTDMNYPAGFMDVVTIPKTGENFRLLYDVKGRYTVHRIKDSEAKFKLCKVTQAFVGQRGVPVIVTHDARTIRYPDPHIKANDTVKVNIASGKVEEYFKFETGKIAMITGGRNLGRVGIIQHRERQHGGFDIVTLRDSMGQDFATRLKNVFIIGEEASAVTLPKGKGVKLTIAEERDRRFQQRIGA